MDNRTLSVRLYGVPVGTLQQVKDGKLRFEYLAQAKQAISMSLPLEVRRHGNVPCESYFSELLPESVEARKAIGRKFQASPNNTFSMLQAIGNDCAGAISFHAPDAAVMPDEFHDISAKPISDAKLEQHIKELPLKPLFLGVEGLRLSLSGVQEKAAICLLDTKICLPTEGTPTTHILKPSIRNYEGTVQNEYLCLKTATAVGLPIPEVQMRKAGSETYLLIERYDRKFDQEKRILRIHQEDFVQALGARQKYQALGGPGLKECFDLMLKVRVPVMDRNTLMEAVIFNYLIGNADAHAKNFAILHKEDGSLSLAPFYDILCTQVYENLSQDMSMKIGSNYPFGNVRLADWEEFAKSAGLSFPVIKKTMARLAEAVQEAINSECNKLKKTDFDTELADKLVLQVRRNCQHLKKILGSG